MVDPLGEGCQPGGQVRRRPGRPHPELGQLKAFNYLLPSVPALCLLAARALDRLPRPALPVLRVAATATVAVVLVAGVIPYRWRDRSGRAHGPTWTSPA